MWRATRRARWWRRSDRLAGGLGPTGALVIFPEGGNFTPSRRRRGISRLEQAARSDEARRARGLANLLPPRSGGVFAAIDSAPTADVIFVAHTGLDDLITVGDVWRALPMEQVIKAKWWRVPAAEVPHDREEVVRWLYDWWERIDAWIAENRPGPVGELRTVLRRLSACRGVFARYPGHGRSIEGQQAPTWPLRAPLTEVHQSKR